MTADSIFQMASSLSVLGWFVLIFISPLWWSFDKFISGVIITILAIVYTWLIVSSCLHPGWFRLWLTLSSQTYRCFIHNIFSLPTSSFNCSGNAFIN